MSRNRRSDDNNGPDGLGALLGVVAFAGLATAGAVALFKTLTEEEPVVERSRPSSSSRGSAAASWSRHPSGATTNDDGGGPARRRPWQPADPRTERSELDAWFQTYRHEKEDDPPENLPEGQCCTICSHYQRSCVLACGHTFCRTCVIKVVERNALCPNCKATISKPPQKIYF